MIRKLLATTALAATVLTSGAANAEPTNLYWGDTHLHTRYSFDAFLSGNLTADPDTAYRWAEGKPVIHPYHKAWIQIDTPLDFLVVSDHAEFMGVMPAIYENRDDEFGDVSFFNSLLRWYFFRTIRNAVANGTGADVFGEILAAVTNPDGPTDVQELAQQNNIEMPIGDTAAIEQSTWDDIAEAADRHNKPGKFTAFIGWEWSTIPGGANLHRIVMSPTDGETAKQFLPFGSDDSQQPQDLWNWLKETEERTGAPFIAMPHNSNISKGYMFAETTLKGEKITPEYARIRAEMEPVVEITQIKGDSETWPTLSPDDEFADFNPYPHYIQMKLEDYVAKEGDYIRSTLKNGLKIEQEIGVNPYKFGVIGSTDAHTGIASADSDNFHGKMALDSVPENKNRQRIGRSVTGWSMQAAGYAGVWAEENTRDSLFAAFKRREVYATTGPRISLRVFGGYGFDQDDAASPDLADAGYDKGVPMGGDLIADQENPAQLLIRATKDPKGANLDRVQVVKGWVDAQGNTNEKIYNVAWGGDRALDDNGALPAVGNSVDLSNGRYTNTIGAAELATVWTDPDYDPAQRAFYYVRVLEIPTPRHSLYDSIALNEGHNETDAGPATIQERAYSSPIWVTP